jgi:uncharacterized protein (DUF1684 family)
MKLCSKDQGRSQNACTTLYSFCLVVRASSLQRLPAPVQSAHSSPTHRLPLNQFFSNLLVLLSLFAISQDADANSTARPADQAAYRAEVEAWRKEREASIASKCGWLSVAGLFFLKEARNTFGRDAGTQVVLPASAPPRAGWFDLRQGRVLAQVNQGVAATFNQQKVQTGTEIELKDTDDLGRSDSLVLGPLTLFVHMSGDKLAIRMLDAESDLLRNFTGLNWFPIDPAYRVAAQFVPFDAPQSVEVPNILGDVERYTSPGVLTFKLGGEEYRLQPFQVGRQENRRFLIVFKDLTSGKETYGAARFVNAALPKEGITTIDFNRTFNPPCAYNPFTTCPLPLPSNRLGVRIPAGEMNYQTHDRRSSPR